MVVPGDSTYPPVRCGANFNNCAKGPDVFNRVFLPGPYLVEAGLVIFDVQLLVFLETGQAGELLGHVARVDVDPELAESAGVLKVILQLVDTF